MADIFQTTFSNAFSWREDWSIFFIQNSQKFVPEGQIEKKKAAMVQLMACCWAGSKPLAIPLLTQFNDTYASPGLNELIIF